MESESKFIVKTIASVVIVLIVLILIFGSFGTVSAGQKGVRTRFSSVVGSVDTGLYFKLPFIEHVVKLDVQTQKEQTTASAASKDLQKVSADVAINYNLDGSKVQDLYTRIGVDYKTKVIDPAIQEVVKAATANYTAEELITKRPEVTEKIQLFLSERLAKNDIVVSSVSITDFDFSPSFNAAIEAKVTAEQNALAAKNKLDQIKFEAEQTVTSAKAEAQSISLKSQAASNEKYVSLKALEVQEAIVKKWDGKGCTSSCYGSGVQAPIQLVNLTK